MPSTEIKDYWRRAWGIGDRVGFKKGSKPPITVKEFITLYSNFKGSDTEFAEILNKKYKPKISDKYTSQIVQHTRNKLNLKSNITQHTGAPTNIKKKLDKVAKLKTLIANANLQDKFVTQKFIAEKAGIKGGAITHYTEVLNTLDGPTAKVDKVLKELLMENKPLDNRLVEVIKKRVGLNTVHTRKHLRLTPTFKTIGPVGGEILLRTTDISNYKGLNLTEQLTKALEIQSGQPTYTGMKGVKSRFYSPAYVTMKFAKDSWNQNKGKGAIQFFDSKGKLIQWQYGLKLPIRDVSFKYNGTMHTYNNLNNTSYIKKYFPEVYEKTIAVNKFKASKVDNPFRPGEKILVRDLVKKIQVDGYKWSPKLGTIDILHGSNGVKGEPFTNLRFNTKDINQIEAGLSQSLKAGKITKTQYNKGLKKLNQSFKGLTGVDYEKAIIDRITTQAKKIKKGQFYGFQELKLNVRDSNKLSSTIQSIMNKKNSGLNIVDIAKWGSAELSALDDIAAKLPSKALNAFGRLLKGVGIVGIPLDVIPIAEAHSKGLGTSVGLMNLAEIYTNLPGIVWEAGEWLTSKAKGKEHEWKPPYETTFGQEYQTRKYQETPVEELEANISNLPLAEGYLEKKIGIVPEELKVIDAETKEALINQMRKEKALADQKKKEERLTGVDKYILSNLDV